MAYKIGRREFLKGAVCTVGSIFGLEAIANDSPVQTEQNASRKFLEVLANNLHTSDTKVVISSYGNYIVSCVKVREEPHMLEAAESFVATYTPPKNGKKEMLEVYINYPTTINGNSHSLRFINPDLQDLPMQVYEHMGFNTFSYDIPTLPKEFQKAHKKAYDDALKELSEYMSPMKDSSIINH